MFIVFYCFWIFVRDNIVWFIVWYKYVNVFFVLVSERIVWLVWFVFIFNFLILLEILL